MSINLVRLRGLVLVPAVLTLAACGAAAASPIPTPTTAPVPTSSATPPSPASAPPSSGESAAPAVLGTIEVGAAPCALEVAPDGRAFVTLYNTGDVVAVDPTSHAVTPLAHLGGSLCGIAWADGSLWVADLTTNQLVEVNPDSGQVGRTVALAGKPWDAQPDATGVWVADRGVPGVVHVDATTAMIDHTVTTGTAPSGIAVVGGHAWVAVQGPGEADRLTSDGTAIEARVTGLGVSPTWFGDGDGTLWVTNTVGGVARIDPATATVTATIALGGVPRDPAVAFGALWVANSGDGILYRIDPATNQVAGTVPLAKGIWAVEAVGSEVWVENYSGTEIYRVDPDQVR